MKLNNFPGRASISTDKRHGTKYLDFRDHGRRVRIPLGTKDSKEAKTLARLKYSEYFSNHRPAQEMTPAEFEASYFDWAKSLKAPDTVRLERLAWRKFMDHRRPRLMSQFERADADRFISSTARQVSTTSVAMFARSLRAIFSKAVEWGAITANIFSKPRLPRGQEDLPRVLTAAEKDQIFASIKEHYPELHDLYVVYLNTGMRRSELLSLGWSYILFDLGKIVVRSSASSSRRVKNRKARTVPMLPTVRAILESRRRLERPFRYNPNFIDKTFLKCVRLAFRVNPEQKLADVDTRGITLHALRRTFCSYLASQNVPPEATMRIMGHSSLAVTMKYYSNVSLDMLRERFDGVDAALNRSDQTPTKVA